MTASIGILLINLGTPEATDPASMRRYLKEFMSDPRVIERRGLWWWALLNGVIIPRRARKSARAYDLIWNRDRDESPLRTITRSQAEKLAATLSGDDRIHVTWAMRYGTPPIADGMARLADAGCRKVLIFPLYPQYSAATTGTAMDRVFDAMKAMRWQPAIRVVPPYFDDPAHIGTLAQHITAQQRALGWTPEACVASFHGLPVAFIEKGDPYRDQCEATVALLRAKLGRGPDTMPLVYQSRGGLAIWLEPGLEETLADLAARGLRRLTVVAPGFAADCIETLEEIKIRAARTFSDAGGEQLRYIPCLNDDPGSVTMLATLARHQLAGWV